MRQKELLIGDYFKANKIMTKEQEIIDLTNFVNQTKAECNITTASAYDPNHPSCGHLTPDDMRAIDKLRKEDFEPEDIAKYIKKCINRSRFSFLEKVLEVMREGYAPFVLDYEDEVNDFFVFVCEEKLKDMFQGRQCPLVEFY